MTMRERRESNIRLVELKPDPTTSAGPEWSESILRNMLGDAFAAAQKAPPLVILNAWSLPPFGKLSHAQLFLRELSAASGTSPVILANVRTDLLAVLEHAFDAEPHVLEAFKLLPTITETGAWAWLGCAEPEIAAYLCAAVRRASPDPRESGEESFTSVSAPLLHAYLAANPSLFRREHFEDDAIAKVTPAPAAIADRLTRDSESCIRDVAGKGRLLQGRFELPSGQLTDECFVTYGLLQNPEAFDLLVASAARYVWLADPDVLVTYSIVSFMVAERLRKATGIPVAHTFGHPVPRFRYGQELAAGSRAFVLTDIVGTGKTLAALESTLRDQQVEVVGEFAVANVYSKAGMRPRALMYPELTPPAGSESDGGDEANDRSRLDPFSGLPYETQRGETEHSQALLPVAYLWQWAHESDASREGHLVYNGMHFTFFIETRRILREHLYRACIADSILDHYATRIDLLVVPKNEGALLLAAELRELLGLLQGDAPPVVPVARDHEAARFILPKTPETGEKEQSVLVVDDGANTGDTLLGLHFALRARRNWRTRYAVFLDRTRGSDRDTLLELLGSDYVAAFRLPIPAYKEWDCPHCIERERQAHSDRPWVSGPRWASLLARLRSSGPRPVPASRTGDEGERSSG